MHRVLLLATLLAIAVNVAADETAAVLDQARKLAWSKHFDEASQLYLEVLRMQPKSGDATLGLAQVRLWQGRYGEARQLFGRLPGNVEAAEGAAVAAYWSGDYRTAAREFRAILASHPDRKTARTSLAEIRAASAPSQQIEVGVVDDDQPFRATRSQVRASLFTDPLTRWDATAGGYSLRSDAAGRHSAPFALLQNETVLPELRLTATTSLGGIRTPDGRSHAIGGASARIRIASHDTIAAAFQRREILTNATRLYPFVSVASLRWQHSSPWLASAGIERDRFSDRNSATAFDAYVLVPVRKSNQWTLWSGVSTLWRDTRDSRFYVTGINATRDGSGGFFHYTYRGAYDPYWTPQDLREGRLIVAFERRFGSGTTMKIQGDAGEAHDRAVVFWPDSGPESFPRDIGQSPFDRAYHPWRLRVSATTPLARGVTLDIGYEHGVTSFYRANTFHATVARRR
ncbi:MAG TPA: tetratricopeptide repeat protein [Thermoanaerobaculia bacterium]|nr:tetratricopeptide repeat protein [Thermoanaerobaculia bacterium]